MKKTHLTEKYEHATALQRLAASDADIDFLFKAADDNRGSSTVYHRAPWISSWLSQKDLDLLCKAEIISNKQLEEDALKAIKQHLFISVMMQKLEAKLNKLVLMHIDRRTYGPVSGDWDIDRIKISFPGHCTTSDGGEWSEYNFGWIYNLCIDIDVSAVLKQKSKPNATPIEQKFSKFRLGTIVYNTEAPGVGASISTWANKFGLFDPAMFVGATPKEESDPKLKTACTYRLNTASQDFKLSEVLDNILIPAIAKYVKAKVEAIRSN